MKFDPSDPIQKTHQYVIQEMENNNQMCSSRRIYYVSATKPADETLRTVVKNTDGDVTVFNNGYLPSQYS